MRVCPQCGKIHPDETSFCSADGTRLTGLDAPGEVNEGPGPGTVLGSYRLVDLLGEGGMGRVFLAEHTRLGRKVAIKMLLGKYAHKVGAIKRIFAEARAVNTINHENIVEITDFIEEEDGGYNYFVMELLKGQSLGDLIRHGGPLPIPRAVGIALQITHAFESVHEKGFVHRDLKPENIFLTERGGRKDFVKLLDFGVAKMAESMDGEALHKTSEGAIIGTPEYMSPEQASGKPVDYRADIYAFGLILFEMVTGQRPFSAKSFGEMVIKHTIGKPPLPSTMKGIKGKIPKDLEALILQCLEKEAHQRPQSMRAIADRLRSIAEAEAMPIEAYGKDRRIPMRKAVMIIGGAVLLSGLIAVLVPVLVLRRQAEVDAYDKAQVRVQDVEASRLVAITLDSLPQGADVFQEDTGRLIGITPVTIKMDKAASGVTFDFKKKGYVTAKQHIALDKDALVVVQFEKEPETDRRATVNPFEQ